MKSIAAERKLVFKADAGSEEAVVVTFFAPHPIEQGDWQCDYEIKGTTLRTSHYAIGVDAVQALTLALGTAPVELRFLEKTRKGVFHFLGEPDHAFT